MHSALKQSKNQILPPFKRKTETDIGLNKLFSFPYAMIIEIQLPMSRIHLDSNLFTFYFITVTCGNLSCHMILENSFIVLLNPFSRRFRFGRDLGSDFKNISGHHLC